MLYVKNSGKSHRYETRKNHIFRVTSLLLLLSVIAACQGGSNVDSEQLSQGNGSETTINYPTNPVFGNNVTAHDPSIFKDDNGDYYTFGSHFAVTKSTNLMQWTQIARDGGSSVLYARPWRDVLANAFAHVGNAPGSTWAPSVHKFGEKYFMYYSLSTFGSSVSFICRVQADSAIGPYDTSEEIVKSDGKGGPNAIDPELFYDTEDRLWMVYGSFFAGIYIKEMYGDGENVGLPKESGYGKLIWQGGHLCAEDYAKKALETAKIMHWVDPSLKLIACGSSNTEIPSYPDWDRVVLETLYDQVDYISMHRYYWFQDTLENFFASYHDMDNFIHTIKSTADFVKAKKRSSKVMKISFDEWNVWYLDEWKPAGWKKAPHILEDQYSLKDALVFSGMLNTLVNNSDRVEIAALAQLVNVIAPIFTKENGNVFKQTIFYPFFAVSNYGRGTALKAIKTGPKFASKYGDVPYVSEAVTVHETKREIAVFLVNYAKENMDVELELRSFGDVKPIDHQVIRHDQLDVKNTFEEEPVKFVKGSLPSVKNSVTTLTLEPLSYHVYRFTY